MRPPQRRPPGGAFAGQVLLREGASAASGKTAEQVTGRAGVPQGSGIMIQLRLDMPDFVPVR